MYTKDFVCVQLTGQSVVKTICSVPLQKSEDVDANREQLEKPPLALYRCMQQGGNTLHTAHALMIIGRVLYEIACCVDVLSNKPPHLWLKDVGRMQ